MKPQENEDITDDERPQMKNPTSPAKCVLPQEKIKSSSVVGEIDK